MKKILALVLALSLVLTLMACAKEAPVETTAPTTEAPTETTAPPTTEEPTTEPPTEAPDYSEVILGSWSWDVFMGPDYWDEIGMDGLNETLIVPLILTFREDNTAEIIIDPSSKSDIYDQMMGLLYSFMPGQLYDAYAEQGMDEAAADEDMMDMYGMTIDEYVDSILSEFTEEDIGDLLYVESDSGEYFVEGDKLNLEGVTFTIVANEAALTLLDCDDEYAASLFGGMPAVLFRTELPETPEVVIDSELLGTWRWEACITKEAWEDMGLTGADCDVPLLYQLTLNADGTGSMTVDTTDKAMQEAVRSVIISSTIALTYAAMADSGLDEAAADEAMKAESGMTVREYVESMYAEMSPEDLMSITGMDQIDEALTFTVEGNVLTVGGNVYTFELDGDTLTLNTETPEMLMTWYGEPPYTLTRIH